jgi:hypothetical protein
MVNEVAVERMLWLTRHFEVLDALLQIARPVPNDVCPDNKVFGPCYLKLISLTKVRNGHNDLNN